MGKKYLTLMVIPHNEDRVREFNISRPLIWGISSALILSFCALVFYTVDYYLAMHRKVEFASLKVENAEMAKQLDRLQEKLSIIRHQVDDLTETDQRMRAWVSLSEPGEDVRQMGVGGITEASPSWEGHLSFESGQRVAQTDVVLDQLLREAHFLKASFDTIASLLASSEEERLHTPSILPIPVEADWWYSSPFGYRTDPFTGLRQFHNGLDIAGHMGTDILATADGRIEKVAHDRLLGWYVAIDHGRGVRTVYGHMQKGIPVKKGQQVKRGDVIGKMGNSGRTTAPHVHYAVHRNRKALNPRKYILEQRSTVSLF